MLRKLSLQPITVKKTIQTITTKGSLNHPTWVTEIAKSQPRGQQTPTAAVSANMCQLTYIGETESSREQRPQLLCCLREVADREQHHSPVPCPGELPEGLVQSSDHGFRAFRHTAGLDHQVVEPDHQQEPTNKEEVLLHLCIRSRCHAYILRIYLWGTKAWACAPTSHTYGTSLEGFFSRQGTQKSISSTSELGGTF